MHVRERISMSGVACIVGVLGVCSSAFAQCQAWKANPPLTGLNNIAFASTTWDPDGPGPLAPMLVVGGSFTATTGGTPLNRIAAWDGAAWQSFGSGMNNTVLALTTVNGQLIAGGIFTSAGGVPASFIAKWNGSAWSPLGTGTNDWVLTLGEYNGEVVAGGYFITAGGVSARRIAHWNGSAWQSFGTGMSGSIVDDILVSSLTVFQGDLVAGGFFTSAGSVSAPRIARWNGTAWQAMSTGMNGEVRALKVFNNELYAGGQFTTAGGLPALRVARWNSPTSAWAPVGAGFTTGNFIADLEEFNGELVAGGLVTQSGTEPTPYAARWDGAAWKSLGSGMNNTVFALTLVGGDLAAAGTFTTAGGLADEHWAFWGCGCAADFDGDGFLTGDDFDAYVAAFESGSVLSDFDRDGFVTGDDFDGYVAAFEAGC